MGGECASELLTSRYGSSEEQAQFIAGSDDREDVLGQVGVAFLHRVEAGLRAQDSEPGRPDVRRHEKAARIGRQRDVQQVAGVQAENRPAVGGEIADLGQRGGNPVRGVEARRVNKVMDLPGALTATVDRGYFDGKHEADGAGAGSRGIAEEPFLELRPDPEQSGLRRDEVLLQLRGPRGMREVSGAEHAQALAQGPPGQVPDVAVLAAGAREPRMNMQVSVEHSAR
jgi:hypothetical protein